MLGFSRVSRRSSEQVEACMDRERPERKTHPRNFESEKTATRSDKTSPLCSSSAFCRFGKATKSSFVTVGPKIDRSNFSKNKTDPGVFQETLWRGSRTSLEIDRCLLFEARATSVITLQANRSYLLVLRTAIRTGRSAGWLACGVESLIKYFFLFCNLFWLDKRRSVEGPGR